MVRARTANAAPTTATSAPTAGPNSVHARTTAAAYTMMINVRAMLLPPVSPAATLAQGPEGTRPEKRVITRDGRHHAVRRARGARAPRPPRAAPAAAATR